MTATRTLALAACLLLAVSLPASAQYYPNIPQAPDACGPGYYAPNVWGAHYGPNYWVRPSCLPFQGMVTPPRGGNGFGGNGFGGNGFGGGFGGPPTFPTHPFVRSPRDFFMAADPN